MTAIPPGLLESHMWHKMTNDEVYRAWIVAMHCWFCTKAEGWDQQRQMALDELHTRKLGLKMLEGKL